MCVIPVSQKIFVLIPYFQHFIESFLFLVIAIVTVVTIVVFKDILHLFTDPLHVAFLLGCPHTHLQIRAVIDNYLTQTHTHACARACKHVQTHTRTQ